MNSLVRHRLLSAAPFAMAALSVLLMVHGVHATHAVHVHVVSSGDPGGGGPPNMRFMVNGDPGGQGPPN